MNWWTLIVALAIAISLVSARGGRGGGGRFSGRSRYSSSSRSTSYRSSFSGNRLSSSSSIRSALLLGTVYGASRYRSRARYIADGTLPEVCYNDNYNKSANGTVSYQGRFFCPLDENMSEDYRYCCGEEGQQYCCTFWDKPGHIVGVVFGIIAGVVALFVVVFCVIKYMKTTKSRNHNRPYTSNISNTSNGQASYPPAYAPPTYEMSCVDSNGKTPYPTSDMMGYSNPPYPTANAPYPPTENAPYPTKDDTGGQHPWKI